MPEQQEKLENLLIERGLIKPDQLQRIHNRMEQDDMDFEDVIREEKIIFPEALAQVRAETIGIPYIDVAAATINDEAMKDISRQAAATYRFFAFDIQDNNLLVAMESPDDFQALEAIKFVAKKKGLMPQIYLASNQGIDKMLGGKAEVQAEIGSALMDFDAELKDTVATGADEKDIAKYIAQAPVTKVVAVIIKHAIEGNASDIHLEPNEKDVRVRYRIDGKLHTSLSLPLNIQHAIISRVKILANLKIDESRLPQDGRFSSRADNKSFDFRVSTMPTVFGEKVVLRILDKSQGAPSFDDLGLYDPQQSIFTKYLKAPHGIILISGPTGSGKSTTLFSSLSLINSPKVNISTLEDPVEYEIPGVNQTQTNAGIGLTFASGLRNMLRQDPDVMMVGEIRDKETAALSIHAALTGHLVLSTIHTNNAIGTIPRLVDMGIDPYLLTATIRLLAAQRLVSRLCEECKQEKPIPTNLLEQIKDELENMPSEYKVSSNQSQPTVFYKATGCPACNELGITGRVAIFEVVPITREIRNAIHESAGYDTLQDIARGAGNITMRQDGILKALNGEVRYEDVLRATSENTTIH